MDDAPVVAVELTADRLRLSRLEDALGELARELAEVGLVVAAPAAVPAIAVTPAAVPTVAVASAAVATVSAVPTVRTLAALPAVRALATVVGVVTRHVDAELDAGVLGADRRVEQVQDGAQRGATAADVIRFAREVKAQVFDTFGVSLAPEPRPMGFLPGELDGLYD